MIRRLVAVASMVTLAVMDCHAASRDEPWWSRPFSVRTAPFTDGQCVADGADAGRGISHAGLYGDLYLADPLVRANTAKAIEACGKIPGFRKIGYFDGAEAGEYLVLTDAQGDIVYNAWSLGQLGKAGSGEARDYSDARWYGYPQFLFERDRFAASRNLPDPGFDLHSFDGSTLRSREAFFDNVCAKSVDGQINEEFVSPPLQQKLGADLDPQLRGLFEKAGVTLMEGRAKVMGKTGWSTVHMCHLDLTGELFPRLLDEQIRRVYGAPLPATKDQAPLALGRQLDGVHFDNVGRTPFIDMRKTGFGDWALDAFKRRLAADSTTRAEFERACRTEGGMAGFTTAAAAVGAVRQCFAQLAIAHPTGAARGPRAGMGKFVPRGNGKGQRRRDGGGRFSDDAPAGAPAATGDWRGDFWLSFAPFRALLAVHQQAARDFYGHIYATFKSTLTPPQAPLITGNLDPMLPGHMLVAGSVDVPLFEWKYETAYQMLGNPDGFGAGFAFLARLAARAGRTGFSIVSLYVPREFSEDDGGGAAHDVLTENAHRDLFFNLLPDSAVLDSGYQFRDGYSPGTAKSRTELNQFVSKHRDWLAPRESLPDYGVFFSAESQVATVSMNQFYTAGHNDEYFAWANLLTASNRQWDVVLPEDIDSGALARYRAIVLPGVISLSKAQRQVLAEYVQSGGALIITGDTGRLLDAASGYRPAPSRFGAQTLGKDRVAACEGYLHAGACDGEALIRALAIADKAVVSGGGNLVPLVRVSRSKSDRNVIYVDVNRYRRLRELRGGTDANSEPIRVQLRVPELSGRCASATTLDDTGVESADGGWGQVTPVKGGVDLTLNRNAVRYYRSVRLQVKECR